MTSRLKRFLETQEDIDLASYTALAPHMPEWWLSSSEKRDIAEFAKLEIAKFAHARSGKAFDDYVRLYQEAIASGDESLINTRESEYREFYLAAAQEFSIFAREESEKNPARWKSLFCQWQVEGQPSSVAREAVSPIRSDLRPDKITDYNLDGLSEATREYVVEYHAREGILPDWVTDFTDPILAAEWESFILKNPNRAGKPKTGI